MSIVLPKRFRIAKVSSKLCTEFRHKIGAVIFDGKEPISIGYNHKKSHPILGNENTYLTLHAECHAISNIPIWVKTKNLSIYVYREHNELGTPMLAKPCDWCTSQILLSKRIKKIYYTISEYPYWKEVKL